MKEELKELKEALQSVDDLLAWASDYTAELHQRRERLLENIKRVEERRDPVYLLGCSESQEDCLIPLRYVIGVYSTYQLAHAAMIDHFVENYDRGDNSLEEWNLGSNIYDVFNCARQRTGVQYIISEEDVH